MYFTCFLKDEIIDYHMKHGRFPDDEIVLPKRIWPDVFVFVWILLLAIPLSVAMIYLVYVGAWLTVGLIVLVLFICESVEWC